MFSLQGKFILVASFCIFVFALIGSLVIISREERMYRQDIVNQGKAIAEISRLTLTNIMVYNELGMMDNQNLIDFIDYFIEDLMKRDKRIRYAAVTDKNGMVLSYSNLDGYGYGRYCNDSVTLKAVSTRKTLITDGDFNGDRVLDIVTPLNISTKAWGALRIGLSTKETRASIAALKKEIVLLITLFYAIAIVITSIGARFLSKPVTKLSQIMDGIKDHGDIEHYVFKLADRRDELGKLQKSFLWMIQRLRDAGIERRKTMEVLGQTEKMVSIGRLASGVAHEINNPLGGITVCFKNLMTLEMDDATREEHVELINDCLQKIKNIVEQLLDFSKMTVTEKSPTDLNGLLNRLLLLLNYAAEEKRITVIRDFEEKLPDISMDQSKMGQVFMNVMINAMQAMDSGGVLTIETGRKDGFYEILIKDTGTGMSPDVVPHIFDPFFTTKSVGEGTGLGLSVSKGIVEQHGGTIEVESEIDAGTIFRIKLPVC
ncbi:MAG: ATP-binding protein [Nitrospiraceae bacterium]|nr:ATP-binding protein [Nitrospiraceae bacterium]